MHCTDNRHGSAHTIDYAGQRRISLCESVAESIMKNRDFGFECHFFSEKSQKIGETVENCTEKMKKHISFLYLSGVFELKEKNKKKLIFP